MTAADDAHAELMRALTVERFTHLPEPPRREPPHVTKTRQEQRHAADRARRKRPA